MYCFSSQRRRRSRNVWAWDAVPSAVRRDEAGRGLPSMSGGKSWVSVNASYAAADPVGACAACRNVLERAVAISSLSRRGVCITRGMRVEQMSLSGGRCCASTRAWRGCDGAGRLLAVGDALRWGSLGHGRWIVR